MTVLAVRTDKPEAELGLYRDNEKLAYFSWQADRQLSSTIHQKIRDLLSSQSMDWGDIEGVVFFAGPGSFTGLRIGVTVANTLATTLEVPVVATNGLGWVETGLKSINQPGASKATVLPIYGRPAHITKPKK